MYSTMFSIIYYLLRCLWYGGCVISCNYEPVHGRVHFSTLGCKAFIILPLVYSACTLYIGLVFDY